MFVARTDAGLCVCLCLSQFALDSRGGLCNVWLCVLADKCEAPSHEEKGRPALPETEEMPENGGASEQTRHNSDDTYIHRGGKKLGEWDHMG